MMKFEKTLDENGKLTIPASALRLSGFLPGEKLSLRTLDSIAVVMPKEMTAMDIVSAIEGLGELSVGLLATLNDVCGTCEDCNECFLDKLADPATPSRIHLPHNMLEELGLESDAKILGCLDKDSGDVLLELAEYASDIEDVSQDTMGLLATAGIALCKLNEHLKEGDIVYGK